MAGEAFEDFVGSAAAGNARALDRLYADLGPIVVGYLRGLGVPNPDDLASEALVLLVHELEEFRGDARDLRVLAVSIAHRRVRARHGSTDPSGSDAEPSLELLPRLNVAQRSVLLLRLLAGLSPKEAGRVLRVPAPVVRARQRRAIRRLGRARVGARACERMVAGLDGESSLGRVLVATRNFLLHKPPLEVTVRHVSEMAAAAARRNGARVVQQFVAAEVPRTSVRGAVALGMAACLALTAGLGAGGVLPAPLQSAVASAAHVLGIELPGAAGSGPSG